MPRDARFRDAGLPIICLEVFSMSHQIVLILLHEVHPTPPQQHRKEARSLLDYSTAAPPMPITRHGPLLLEPYLHGVDQVMKKLSYTRVALQLFRSLMQRGNGTQRNASAREKRPSTAKSSKPKASLTQQSSSSHATQTQPSSKPQAVSSSSTTSAVPATTAVITSVISRPDITIRQAGCWTRFWLCIGCISPEHLDGHH
ncbi:hypothetical protein P692DRAFT_20954017 [Suillus brevipes Sb2]|nr:hypothetical protein P692DRAFT_20954017 [Suillus brevipes Sb2]